MSDRVEMPVWGWGDPDQARSIPPGALAEISDRFDVSEPLQGYADASDFQIPQSRCSQALLDQLSRIVGADGVDVSVRSRVLRSLGKSYPDLCRGRSGRLDSAIDCVVRVTSAEEVSGVLAAAAAHSAAVVPFGGGTSVVGGLDPITGGHGSCISLDLTLMSGLVSIDTNSRLARFLPGTSGPEAERLLAMSGLTIGHFPQSFMHATLGGFAATRSSGQASTGYGRFDANVKGLELIAPTGGISLAPSPGTAAGPDLRELIVGSEGTLGVITSVDLQLAESPALIEDRAWLVESFAAGREILQRLEQDDCAPAVARLSDEDETEISLRLSASGRKGELLSRYSAARGISHPCILITGFEGSESELPARIRRAYGIVRSCGAVSLGESAGKAWRHGRFAGPYLRDVLMDRGLLVETLETSAPWSGLERLYRGVSDALHASLARAGGEPIVMCHVSHLYPTGASLYFTFIGNQPGETLEEQIAHWSTVKHAAGDAIKACGGTITHHHAVGVDHSHWMDREVGELGLEALRAVKDRLDPQGIMNPGKLIPEG